MKPSDLLIIGGGPAGLSAAINGASEGLSVSLMDNGSMLGGQARESSAIENYPGFPDGITGDGLMSRLVRQAHRFQTHMICPSSAAALDSCPDGLIRVTTDDYTEHHARAVLLATGLQYRRLEARNIAQFVGRGVYYGVPSGKALHKAGSTVAVVGGANSAGQAVLNLAKDGRTKVKLMIRKQLTLQMSNYLVERIRTASNIEVCEDCEVTECFGDTCLRQVTVIQQGQLTRYDLAAMYIYIGAVPKTLWLRGSVELDDRRFVKTWKDVEGEVPGRDRLPYETSMPGVFAAGDVRSSSTKRIATAIGEGAAALQMIHSYLGAT